MLTGILIFIVVIALLFTFLLYRMAVSSRSMEVTLGHQAGELRACPDTPNCVSSQASVSDSHYIAPLQDNDGSRWQRLATVLENMEGSARVNSESNYVYYTFRSSLLGFIDDAEFLYVPEQGVIHVRSASRVGHSDMNANRKRVDMIRAAL